MSDLDFKIEVYKIFVSTITANESRRQRALTVYLGMTAAVATVTSSINDIELIVPAIVVWVISAIWWLSVKYFRNLAQAKFKVIAELEKDFPIAPFKIEWEKFKRRRNLISLTHLEMVVPTLVFILATIYIIFWMCSKLHYIIQ